jgi:hypothetical protein
MFMHNIRSILLRRDYAHHNNKHRILYIVFTTKLWKTQPDE